MRKNYLDQIKRIIEKNEKGTVFVAADFTDIADNMIIRKSLSLLCKRKIVVRINQGLYLYPKYSALTGEMIPADIDDIAFALARNYGWNIVVNGEFALNIFGLSNQVPAKYEYLSDGPYREYTIDGYKLKFMHRTNKNIRGLSYKTSLIVSAIKTIGNGKINSSIVDILRDKLDKKEIENLLEETKYVTKWIRLTIEDIYRKELLAC